MEVFIEKTNSKIKASAKTVSDLLKKLKINHTTVIATRDGEIIMEEAKLNEKDNVKILSVISGG